MKKILVLLFVLFMTSCTDLSDKAHNDTVETNTSRTSETVALPKSELTPETTTTETTTETTTAETTAATTAEITTVSLAADTTAATASSKTITDDDYQVLGENGILVVKRNGHFMGLMACWGTFSACDVYINSINAYASDLPEVQVYSMVVPTNVEFYLPANQKGFSASQKEKIDYINQNLENVIAADAYQALEKHSEKEIFARTDHHWFPLGAYYAAEQLADVARFDFPPLSEYDKVTKGGYVGSLYNYSKDENLRNDPEDFTMFIPRKELAVTYYDTSFENGESGDLFVTRDGSAYYCSFLGADKLIAKIETGAATGRVLAVFKESYGNAIIPFLTYGFDTIYVCDIRYFELNAVEFCKEVGVTDLLFATCTFTPAGVNNKYFDIIRTKGGE